MARLLTRTIKPIWGLAALFLACGPGEGLSTLPAALALSIDEQSAIDGIDFQSVPVGSSVIRHITLTDTAHGVLSIKNFKQTGDAVFVAGDVPKTVQPDKPGIFTVTFSPLAEAPYNGTIVFNTNDPKQALVTLTLKGQGGNPSLVVCVGPTDQTNGPNCTDAGRRIDFKQTIQRDAIVTLGKTRAIRLLATTDSEVILHSVTLTGDTSAFIVDNIPAQTSIPGNSDTFFKVNFLPPGPGNFSAELTIESNDGLHPQTIVPLQGVGETDCQVFDETKTQTTAPLQKIDVLFVIDVSGSMASTLAGIESQFNAFVEQLAGSSMDFRLAVTTTDMIDPGDGDVGTLVRGPLTHLTVVSSASPPSGGIDAAFRDILSDVGADPSIEYTHVGTSYDILAAAAAVTATTDTVPFVPNTTACTTKYCGRDFTAADCPADPVHGARTSDFWRDDARLAIIMVSDEDDGGTSNNGDATNASDYATYFRALAQSKLGGTADPDLYLRVVAIADPGNGSQGCAQSNATCDGIACPPDASPPCVDGTPRFHALIDALGPAQGLFIDYCADIQHSLTVSGGFAGQSDCIFDLADGVLTADPSNAVSVVGGATLAANQWSYVPVSPGHPNGELEVVGASCPGLNGQVKIDYNSCLRSADFDNDGVADIQDNCPCDKNADQTDINNDGIGDVCQNEANPASCL